MKLFILITIVSVLKLSSGTSQPPPPTTGPIVTNAPHMSPTTNGNHTDGDHSTAAHKTQEAPSTRGVMETKLAPGSTVDNLLSKAPSSGPTVSQVKTESSQTPKPLATNPPSTGPSQPPKAQETLAHVTGSSPPPPSKETLAPPAGSFAPTKSITLAPPPPDRNGSNVTMGPTSLKPTMVPMTSLPPTRSTITPISDNPLIANMSADARKLIDLLNSTWIPTSPEFASKLDKDRSLLIPLLDRIDWTKDCMNGMVYLKMLEDEFVRNGDDDIVTMERLQKVLPCKQDCFFDRLLRANYTNDTVNFAKDIMKVINPAVLPQCQNTIGKLLPPRNASNSSAPVSFSDVMSATSNGALPLGAIMTPTEISNILPADALKVIESFQSKLDDTSAQKLASKLDANTNFSLVATVAAFVRPEILARAPPKDLISNINKFADKCDDSQALVVANAVISGGNREDIIGLLNNTDSKFANKIPLSVMKSQGIDIKSIPEKAVPDSLRQEVANTELSTKKLTDLDASTLLVIAPKINNDHMSKIEPKNLINILSGISGSSVGLKSNQRAAFLENILKDYAGLSDDDAATKFDSMNTTSVEAMAEIIVSSNSSIYNWLRTTNNFIKVIEKNSKIPSSKCCSFLYQSRALYASEAIKRLVPTKANIKASHLGTLGPCFAGLIPSDYLNALSTDDFKSQLSYFNLQSFQPNSSVTPVIKTKLEAIYNDLTTDTERTSFISNIGSLITYMNMTKIPNSIRKTSASTILNNIKSDRDLSSSDVQKCRVGSGDDTAANVINQEAKKVAVNSALDRSSSRRKRQASSSLTCDLINNIISAIDMVSAEDFTNMPQSEFTPCIQVLGQTSNQMSAAQYTALAAKTPITSLTDSNLATYNKILTGYSSSDLAKLSISSDASIQALGKINSFSSDQLSSLISAIKKNGDITAAKFSYIGNLACGMSQSDLNKISDADFKSNIKALSVLDAQSCPSLSLLYNKAKNAMSFSSPDSVTITEIDSLAAGMSPTDATGLSTASIQSLSTSALYMMPAATVNSFTAIQVKSLNSDQLNSLLSSPSASSFSSTTKTLLANAAQGIDVTKVDLSLSGQVTPSSSSMVRFESVSLVFLSALTMIIMRAF